MTQSLSSESSVGGSLVSIVVVTYNARAYVKKCLETIRALTQSNYELIVVDNASRKETRDYLRGEKGLKLILNKDNRLWCAGCNQGMQAAEPGSPFLLLLNPDVEVLRSDWLEIMVRVMESDPRVGHGGPVASLFGYRAGVWFLGRALYHVPAKDGGGTGLHGRR